MSPRRGQPARAAVPEPAAQQMYCRFRGECLGVAAARNWRGMSCAGCGDYQALSRLEHRADMEAMAGLLAAVAGAATERRPGVRATRARRPKEQAMQCAATSEETPVGGMDVLAEADDIGPEVLLAWITEGPARPPESRKELLEWAHETGGDPS